MTDNEIIKALECCRDDTCVSCPICTEGLCNGGLHKNTLDLINRQKAEIERLEQNINGIDIVSRNHIKVIRTQAIKEFAEEFEYFVLNEDIEVVEPKCKDYESYINGANQFRYQIKNGINNIIKEMTEVNENDRA